MHAPNGTGRVRQATPRLQAQEIQWLTDPVVATCAAGVDDTMPGVTVVAAGSTEELARALGALGDPDARARARIALASLVAERSSVRVKEGVLRAVCGLCTDSEAIDADASIILQS